jgi:hypothetical protein
MSDHGIVQGLAVTGVLIAVMLNAWAGVLLAAGILLGYVLSGGTRRRAS